MKTNDNIKQKDFGQDLTKTDCPNLQTGSPENLPTHKAELKLVQQLRKNFYTNHGQQYLQSAPGHSALGQLSRLVGVLQNESAECPVGLTTSFAAVRKEIAQCMQQCLQDVPEQNRGIDAIQSLIDDYKVIQFLPDQKMSVSLEAVHLILQDNYKDSSLCFLLNLFLAGWNQLTTKVVTIY